MTDGRARFAIESARDALTAVMGGQHRAALDLLGRMTPGERAELRRAAEWLAEGWREPLPRADSRRPPEPLTGPWMVRTLGSE